MMIFLRGLGEFATRGGDISGFPDFVGMLGHGWFAGIPMPLWILIACVALWHLILNKTRLGLTIYMAGSISRRRAIPASIPSGRSCWSIRCPA